MKFVIVFVGLMIQVQQPSINTAVVPVIPDHTRQMRVREIDVVEGKEVLLSKPYVHEEGPFIAIDLEHLHIRFQDLGEPMPVRRDGSFDRYVPNLTKVASKCYKLKKTVEDRDIGDKEFAGFIDYGGGELSTGKTYPLKAEMVADSPSWQGRRCVACETRLEATPATPTVRVEIKDSDTKYEFNLRTIAEVEVINQRIKKKLGFGDRIEGLFRRQKFASGGHWNHNFAVFDTSDLACDADKKGKGPHQGNFGECLEIKNCPKKRRLTNRGLVEILSTYDVECSSSQWP